MIELTQVTPDRSMFARPDLHGNIEKNGDRDLIIAYITLRLLFSEVVNVHSACIMHQV